MHNPFCKTDVSEDADVKFLGTCEDAVTMIFLVLNIHEDSGLLECIFKILHSFKFKIIRSGK